MVGLVFFVFVFCRFASRCDVEPSSSFFFVVVVVVEISCSSDFRNIKRLKKKTAFYIFFFFVLSFFFFCSPFLLIDDCLRLMSGGSFKPGTSVIVSLFFCLFVCLCCSVSLFSFFFFSSVIRFHILYSRVKIEVYAAHSWRKETKP